MNSMMIESGLESMLLIASANTTTSDTVVVQGDATMQGDTGVEVNSGMQTGTMVDPTMPGGMAGGKTALLNSWPFVCGITFAVLVVSIVIGAFLARRKIKKGIEIYED